MKQAILGFLVDQPMHGYELKRALSPALPREQRVNDGILYPLLKRMDAEGLISGRVERRANGRERRVYHPTAAGRRAFLEWLEGGVDEEDEVAYDFLLGNRFRSRSLFFGRLAPHAQPGSSKPSLAEAVANLENFRGSGMGMVGRGGVR